MPVEMNPVVGFRAFGRSRDQLDARGPIGREFPFVGFIETAAGQDHHNAGEEDDQDISV